MFKNLIFILTGLLLPVYLFAQGHTTISANTPRMVVGIVVEDMNPDYIERYWNKFGTGCFQRLFSKGFICGHLLILSLAYNPPVKTFFFWISSSHAPHPQ